MSLERNDPSGDMPKMTAQQVIDRAHEYVVLCMEYLSAAPNPAENEQEFDAHVLEIETVVLFPNLNDAQRHALCALRHAALGCALGIRTLGPHSKEHIRAVDECEKAYVRTMDAVREHVWPHLTPMQRQIVKLEYMTRLHED